MERNSCCGAEAAEGGGAELVRGGVGVVRGSESRR